MIRYRCSDCGMSSYSASTAKKVGPCPGCLEPLTREEGSDVFEPSLVDAPPVVTFATGAED